MTKSSWKIPFVDYNLLCDIIKNKNHIKTNSRASIILQSFIGLTFYIHTGKIYKKIIITEDMVGHKLGEFSFTRKLGNIHKKKKKK